MDKANLVKAIGIVGGVMTVVVLIVFLWPLFAALGTIIISIVILALPLIIAVAAVVLVYRHLQSKDDAGKR
jgi:hypothetical protein